MAHTQILVRHVSVMNRNPWIEWKVLLLLLYILTPCDTAAFSSSPLHLCWEGKELQEKNSFLSCTSPGNEFWSICSFNICLPTRSPAPWEQWPHLPVRIRLYPHYLASARHTESTSWINTLKTEWTYPSQSWRTSWHKDSANMQQYSCCANIWKVFKTPEEQ